MKYSLPICIMMLMHHFALSQEINLEGIKVIGRHDKNAKGHIEMIGSACHFIFQTEGTARISAYVPAGMNDGYLQYTVNEGEAHRVKIKAGDTTWITINHADKQTIGVYKATEAKTSPVFINHIKAKEPRISVIPWPPNGNIEFIGNSITCGAAADESDMNCATGNYHDHHNAYDAYGPRVARKLGMQYILSSVSGIGIYRNWNSDGPTMPLVYENLALDTADKRRYNFREFTPDIVCIALGTNDFSNGDGKTPRNRFDSAQYISHYVDFVRKVQTRYRGAKMVLMSSPMVQGANRKMLESCLTSVAQQSKGNIQLFFFKEMQPTGCGSHPSVEEHGLMAEELFPFLRSLL